ncbi:glycosyltransferase family 39 protein [Streptomyces sp. BHT-5-2]|uniref:glycosyltransferase family 39 protein n=1 Tax=Streptomyces sp. BHT-5-2 TaxID=2866715 RepID=UPI0021B1542B|nr:glycosyltransferase family 39 protein [Streptomyces sp. BHT-5-2]
MSKYRADGGSACGCPVHGPCAHNARTAPAAPRDTLLAPPATTTAAPAPDTGRRRTAGVLAVPAIPGLLALALGLWGVARDGAAWRDEAATWQVARRSLPEIWHMLDTVDVVHGLYYVLIHGVFELFGASLPALRAPSVLAMAATAVCTAAVGRRLAGPWVGVAAGIALALHPDMQRYAQEGRSYALVAAAVALATWLLVGTAAPVAGTRPTRCLRWSAYAATLLAAAYLNWFSLLLLPAHAITVLVAHRRGARHLLAPWTAAALVAVAGALPLIAASYPQAGQISWIQPVTWTTLAALAAVFSAAVICARLPYGPAARTAAAAHMTPASVGLPLLAAPQLGLFLASFVKPLYVERYVLFASIGFALLLGTGIAAGVHALPVRGGLALVATTVIAFLALLPVELHLRSATSRTDDVMATAEKVASVARPGDGVLFLPALRRDTASVTPSAFTGLHDLALAEDPISSGTLEGIEAGPGAIRAAVLAQPRVVLVTDPDVAPADLASEREATKRRVLDEHFTRTGTWKVGGRLVETYERAVHSGGAQQLEPLSATSMPSTAVLFSPGRTMFGPAVTGYHLAAHVAEHGGMDHECRAIGTTFAPGGRAFARPSTAHIWSPSRDRRSGRGGSAWP